MSNNEIILTGLMCLSILLLVLFMFSLFLSWAVSYTGFLLIGGLLTGIAPAIAIWREKERSKNEDRW